VTSTFRTLDSTAVALATLRLMQMPGHHAGVVLACSPHPFTQAQNLPPQGDEPVAHSCCEPLWKNFSAPDTLSACPHPPTNTHMLLSVPLHMQHQRRLKKKQASSSADGGLIQNHTGQMISPSTPSPFVSHSSPISEQQRGGEGGEKWPIFQLVR